MRITGAEWTAKVNMIRVFCDYCHHSFSHRSDRWRVRCVACGATADLADLRKDYEKRMGGVV